MAEQDPASEQVACNPTNGAMARIVAGQRLTKGVYGLLVRGPGLHGTLETDDCFSQERIVAKVIGSVCRQENGCILWTGTKDPHGYGLVLVARRTRANGTRFNVQRKAHRVVWELLCGPVADGKCLDHECRQRDCVNPGHMSITTIGENVRRGIPAASRRTHCPRGHEYSIENTTVLSKESGKKCRKCRICNRETLRALRAANKERTGFTTGLDREKHNARSRAAYAAKKLLTAGVQP